MKGAVDMGLPKDMDMNLVFQNMSQMVAVMKDQVDKDQFPM